MFTQDTPLTLAFSLSLGPKALVSGPVYLLFPTRIFFSQSEWLSTYHLDLSLMLLYKMTSPAFPEKEPGTAPGPWQALHK